MPGDPIIAFESVKLSFGQHVVHKNLSFEINEGEGVTFLGPSGCGKTIILKLIIGLLLPTAGKVNVVGQSMGDMTEDERRKVRTQIGMLFQGAALFDSLNVYENIAYSLREFQECDESKIKQKVEECLAVIGLSGIEKKLPSQLSGGQKKRVGLARALASSPRIMLFDEPTTGLDPTATRMIDDLILKLKGEMGITCVAVTHDIESAKRISDRWILINNSGILANGPVNELVKGSEPVQDFITGNWDADSANAAGGQR